MTAVCDLWKVNREKRRRPSEKAYGRAPRAFQYMEELLALKDVDAVIISTADFQHAPILKLAVEAGKDVYCEKPMGNVLEEAKAARDAVLDAQTHRADRHAASQRALPDRRPRPDRYRRAGRRQQSTKSSGTTTVRAGAAVPK